MSLIKVEFRNDSPNESPKYAREGDSGMDVRAWLDSESIIVKPFERVLVHTGLHALIPRGYEIQVRSRSGTALKKGLVVLNEPGTIDWSYTGDISVIIWNASPVPVVLENGERFAQIVLCRVEEMDAVFSKELNSEELKIREKIRGENGFNSTGIK